MAQRGPKGSELRLKFGWFLSQGADPHHPFLEGRQVEIIWMRKLPPPPHWDSAKPYQIWAMQRSCANVNSALNESAELTQGAL